MRRVAASKAPPGAQTASLYTLMAPTGGMNVRDHPSLLPPNESEWMVNCIPTSQGIQPRRPLISHATGFADQPESLMVYTSASGVETLFAAAGTAFYNATAAGAIGAAVVSGLTNAKWNSLNYTLSTGTPYLCCFNGVDSPRYWDGATWITITGVSTPAITGLTTSTITGAFVHQRRMWLVQSNSMKVWYLPADSVGGAATALDLGGIATKGGYIVAGNTWTIDAGDGVNDYWAVVTSNGQLIVYQGIDPSSATTWTLVGVWNIPKPLNTTSLYKFKNDLLIITVAGVVSVQRSLNGETGNYTFITDKLTPIYTLAVRAPLTSVLTNTRWFFMELERDDVLILCTQESDYCWVMNRSTGAWGQYNLNIICGAVFASNIYFSIMTGGAYDKQIYRMSNSATSSGAVRSEFAIAPSQLGIAGQMKKVTQIAPIFETSGSLDIYANWGINYDYPSSLSILGTFTSTNNLAPFNQLPGYGMAFTLAFIFDTNASTYSLIGANVLYEVGGITYPNT